MISLNRFSCLIKKYNALCNRSPGRHRMDKIAQLKTQNYFQRILATGILSCLGMKIK